MNKQIEELKSHLDTMIGNSSQLKAEKLVKLGYRRQSELLINDSKSNNSEVMRNKQIGEIGKILTEYEDCGDCNNCPYHECCGEERIATNLYNAGYRKQSEGEWIVSGMFDDFLKCSSCGYQQPWQTAIEYKYCPNCGAKMKGGAE